MMMPRGSPPAAGGGLSATTLADVPYREPVNGWIHFAGALMAAAWLPALWASAERSGSLRHLVGAAVFGGTGLLMFASSALYHLGPRSRRHVLYRRIDHAMIYVFIAGTFTPICLIGLRESALGVPPLVAMWSLACLGIVQKVCWLHAPRALSTGMYLAVGWLGAVSVPTLLHTTPPAFFGWLLGGGLLYTAGALVYAARWPRGIPGVFGFHELWHLIVLAASASHYWAVFAYLLPHE
jgi:hemolysin III